MRERFLLYCAALAILVNFACAEPVGTCPEENEEYVTFLTDSDDCRIFYKCVWGVPYKYDCPDDLYFNPDLNVCDYPEQTDCGSAGGGNTDGGNDSVEESLDGDSEEADDGNSVVGECPADNDGDAVHLPHESDCTLFYKCDWGVPVLQECPDGLHFNPTLEVCDWPEDAGCENGTGDNGEDSGNSEDDGDNGNAEDNGDGEENGNGEDNGNGDGDTDAGDDGSSAVGECPADNDGDAVHLPHESDCTLFYKCDWGVPVLQECPDGLHFNPTLEVCDWPEDAGCENGTGDNGEDSENNGGDDDNGNGENNGDGEDNGDGENDGDSDTGDDGSSVVGECPADNDGDAVHLPHESDCTLFYKCDWGVPVLQECPDGLHFNPTLEVCDWPEDAGCENGTGDNGEDSGNGGGDGDNGNGEDNGGSDDNGDGEDNGDSEDDGNSDTGDDGSSAVGECPSDNDGDAVHLPHESDCMLFYKCDWGVPILQECPDGLHFNPTLEVCDWPEDAGCENGTGDNGEDSGNSEDDGDNGNGEDNEDGEENGNDEDNGNGDGDSDAGDDGSSAVGECPADNDGDAVHLPHESDCTLFYKCDWGVPILQECPDGLHFNPTLEVCDWPEDAGCENGTGDNEDSGNGGGDGDNGNGEDNGGSDDNGDGEDNGDSEDDGNSDTGDDGSSAVGECPSDNDGDAVHLPHESDCTLFYKCDWGVPILQECPDGLHFNPTLEVCDWPEDAGCENGTGDNGEDSGNSEDDGDNGNGEGDGDGEENGNGEDNGNGDGDSDAGDDGSSAVGECPADNDGDAVHLPHESDCTLFYKCDWGVPILQECPDGLHFNPTLEVCDWPEDAGCENGTGNNGEDSGNGGDDDDNENGEDNGDGEENENGEENGNGEDNGNGDADSDAGDDGSSAVGECPSDNDGDAVHLPHESDCTLFYKCDWGVPVLQECPDGLHFNPILEVCDWPEDAGCENGAGDNGEDSENGGDDGDNGNGEGNEGGEDNGDSENNGDSDGDSDAGDDGSSAVGECPSDNDGDAVHLPHESDCTLFYKCDWGVPVLQECPDDLHFNPTLEVCDWPENAGCENGAGDNNGDSGNGSDNGNGEDNGEDSEDNGEDNEDNGNGENNGDGEDNGDDDGNGDAGDDSSAVGECPADNDGNAVHLPHESDCTLFYKCDWGVPVLQECDDGLHFNPTLEVCDWPENAGCETGETGADENTDDDGSDGDDVDDSANESADDGSDNGSGFCDTLSCPAENEEYVTFISNPTDCTKFCKCNWGLAYEFICPDGLYFNPTLNVCDYPEDSGCTM